MNDQDLYGEIMRGLGRVEGKIDGINQRLDGINGVIKHHGNKIDILETDSASIKGKAAVIGGIFGAVVIVVWEFVKKMLK